MDFEEHRDALAARGIGDSRSLCAQLLEETGVAILPGPDFGRSDAELSARVAYVNFDGGAAIEALASPTETPDTPFLMTQCGETLEAIDALCNWVLQK